MISDFIRFIMQRRLTAGLLTAVLALHPFTVPLSACLMAFVVLRRGFLDGLLMLAAAIGAAGLVCVLHNEKLLMDLGPVALEFISIFVGAYSLYILRSLGLTLVICAALYALVIFVFYGIIMGNVSAADFIYLLSCRLQEAFSAAGTNYALPEDAVNELSRQLAYGGVGIFYAQWILVLFGARYIQAKFYNPGGFGAEFKALTMPKSVSIVALLAILMVLFVKTLPFTLVVISWLTIVMAVLFSLGLVHWFAQQRHISWVYLVIFYSILLIYWPIVALLLGIMACLDPWLDIRKLYLNRRVIKG